MPLIDDSDKGPTTSDGTPVTLGSPEDLARFYEKVKCTEEEALTKKHLEWGWKNLGKYDGDAIAHVIKSNKTCITLDLFVNELFVDGGLPLCKALSSNTVLKSIDLQQAQVGPPGAKFIGEALKVTPSLMNLKMHYNHLGPEGVAFICDGLKANKTLTNLVISDNGIMAEGVAALASMLETNVTLFRLDASKNAGLTSGTGLPETKALLVKAGEAHEKKRAAAPKKTAHDSLAFRLIMEDSPGQMWTPNGFVNKPKFPKVITKSGKELNKRSNDWAKATAEGTVDRGNPF